MLSREESSMAELKTLGPFYVPSTATVKRRYHAMVKPIGAVCNLDCTYCYYLHKKELLGTSSKFHMPDEILETHIRQYIEGQDGPEVVFSWQGGEPALLGIEFFRKAVNLQKKYKRPNQRVENDLQTNGTLLDEEWAKFLSEHNFLVGLSIDGPKKLHDAFRVAKDGSPTFEKVYAASQLLHKNHIKFNTLTVVNKLNAQRPLDVYRFLRNEVRPFEMQFIPCVEPKVFCTVAPQTWDWHMLAEYDSPAAHPGTPDSVVTDWAVDPDDWGKFLCKVWDDWFNRDYGKVFVNLFETAVAQWMGMEAQVCIYHDFCGKGVALEHDGNLYSCDHYVYPEYRLGNILETTSSQMVFSERQREFGFAKSENLSQYCRDCKYLFACNGDCPKNRMIRTPSGEPGLSYLCQGHRKFWSHIDPYMKEIVRRVRQEQSQV
jgi:serine-type anaerobic sulfatase-maturating enzyme